MATFSYKVILDEGVATVQIAGVINEDSAVDKLNIEGGGKVRFDFKSCTAINSCGIRDWVTLMGTLAHRPIEFTNCSKIIVDQVNMVKGFLPDGAEIVSILAPYFCDRCDEEVAKPVWVSELSGPHAPEASCPSCGDDLEFDTNERQFFQFLLARDSEGAA